MEGTGYMACVRVVCAACGLAFRFVGLEAGFDVAHPMVSAAATELRAPIEPADPPLVKTTATFRVPAVLTQH